MKTQVIQLNVHDDLVSIRDRMAWAKTPRILLVWPRQGSVGVRPLDLTLLRRHAQGLGAELGLVTRDGEIRAAARELGLTVFKSSADAQKRTWLEKHSARPQRRFPRADLRSQRDSLPEAQIFNFRAHPARRLAVFAVGVLAVLALVLAFIPSAEIQMTMPEQKQNLTLTVSATDDAEQVQLSGLVPMYHLTLTVSGSASALASGSLLLAGQSASGQVQLTNLTTSAQTLPSGSLVQTASSPPVVFITVEKVVVPAGKGETAAVSIRAASAGPGANLNAGQITLVAGPLSSKLAVTNLSATSGGTQSSVAMPTAQDREDLRKRLLGDLQRQALSNFLGMAATGDELFPSTLVQTRVLEESFDPPEGAAGEKVTLNLRAEYSLGYAAGTDLDQLARWVLDASLPVGNTALDGTVGLERVSSFSMGQGVVRWQMRISRSVRPSRDPNQVIAVVQGRDRNRAAILLTSAYGLTQTPVIEVQPGWWPWMPFLPMRITVKG